MVYTVTKFLHAISGHINVDLSLSSEVRNINNHRKRWVVNVFSQLLSALLTGFDIVHLWRKYALIANDLIRPPVS